MIKAPFSRPSVWPAESLHDPIRNKRNAAAYRNADADGHMESLPLKLRFHVHVCVAAPSASALRLRCVLIATVHFRGNDSMCPSASVFLYAAVLRLFRIGSCSDLACETHV